MNKPRAASQAVEGDLTPKPPVNVEPDLPAARETIMEPLVASLGADKVKRTVDLHG